MLAVAGQLEGTLRRLSHRLPRWQRREGEAGIHCAIGGNVTGAASVMTGTREMAPSAPPRFVSTLT
jgi:hypothetical protein